MFFPWVVKILNFKILNLKNSFLIKFSAQPGRLFFLILKKVRRILSAKNPKKTVIKRPIRDKIQE
jgi:hypothetical protein